MWIAWHQPFEPPPKINLEKLTWKYRMPDCDDLGMVFSLQHLARCLERRLQNCAIVKQHYQGEKFSLWQERVERAFYTVLLLLAVVSRTYNEPLERDSGRSIMPDYGFNPQKEFTDWNYDEALKGLAALLRREYGMDPIDNPNSQDPFIEIAKDILRHPAYMCYVDVEKQEPVFGRFAEWFVQSTLELYRTAPPEEEASWCLFNCHSDPDSADWDNSSYALYDASALNQQFKRSSDNSGAAKFVFYELMRALLMHSVLKDHLTLRWARYDDVPYEFNPNNDEPPTKSRFGKPELPPRKARIIVVVSPENFTPCEVITSEKVSKRFRVVDVNCGRREGPPDIDVLMGKLVECSYGRGMWPRDMNATLARYDPLLTPWHFMVAREFGLYLKNGSAEISLGLPRWEPL